MLACIDIGNSRTKLRIGNENYKFVNNKLDKNIIKELALEYNIDALYYSSVNNPTLSKLVKIINYINDKYDKNIELIDSVELLKDQTILDFSDVEGMGSDRKLGLIAAQKIIVPPLITIDCGTAITVNILSVTKKVLGGAILPGLYTSALALNHFTSKLPLVGVEISSYNIINNTYGAVNFGVKSATLGGLEYAITQIKEDVFAGKVVPVIFTGGYGSMLMDTLIKNEDFKSSIFIADLVLDGIKLLVETKFNKDNQDN